MFEQLRFSTNKVIQQATDSVLEVLLLFVLFVYLYLYPLALHLLPLVESRLRFELKQDLIDQLDVHVHLHDEVSELFSLERVKLMRDSLSCGLAIFLPLSFLLGS